MCSLLGFGSAIVESDLNPNVAGVFPLAVQTMPLIALSSASHDYIAQVNPGFADQFGLFIVIEDGQLKLEVVWRVVDNKSELLVPFGCLAASDIRRGLLRLLAQSSSAVRVLLPDRLAIRQVLGSIDDQDERADLGAINAHVGENAGRVHSIERIWDFGLGRHGVDI